MKGWQIFLVQSTQCRNKICSFHNTQCLDLHTFYNCFTDFDQCVASLSEPTYQWQTNGNDFLSFGQEGQKNVRIFFFFILGDIYFFLHFYNPVYKILASPYKNLISIENNLAKRQFVHAENFLLFIHITWSIEVFVFFSSSQSVWTLNS